MHNETSKWVAKWLQTSHATHQLRLAMRKVSNSTGASRLDQNWSSNNNNNNNYKADTKTNQEVTLRIPGEEASAWSRRTKNTTNFMANFTHRSQRRSHIDKNDKLSNKLINNDLIGVQRRHLENDSDPLAANPVILQGAPGLPGPKVSFRISTILLS